MWGILSKDYCKCMGKAINQELLDEYTQCFDKLDKHIKKRDIKGVEETYGKLLYIKQTMRPSITSGQFHAQNVDCLNLLLQDAISSKKVNLPYLEACLKPFFNQMYAAME